MTQRILGLGGGRLRRRFLLTHPGNDFGNTPQSRVTVTFESLADLPGGGDTTHATSITCVANDGSGASVGSSTSNTLTTDDVLTSQTPLRCTIAYEDP